MSHHLNPTWSSEWVQHTLNEVRFQGPQSPTCFSQISIDSRDLQPGALFVAIPGERHDGHNFIPEAIQKGARGLLYDPTSIDCHPFPHYLYQYPVSQPLNAYRKLAAAWRKQFSIPILAIAGSAGKTTTKEYLAALLTGKYSHVLKTQGSQNGCLGIPMTLLKLTHEHSIAVIEIGIDCPGTMKQHLELVQPTGGLVTLIGPEHLEQLIDLETIAQEECLLLRWIHQHNGITVINADDPWIQAHTQHLAPQKVYTFSLKNSVEFSTPQTLSGTWHGSELQCQGMGLEPFRISVPLPGRHQAMNLLGALALARALGLNVAEMQTGLTSFQAPPGRSMLCHLPGATTVLCDYYNAQPQSMQAGLELLASYGSQNTWACLADMLELGQHSDHFHAQLAETILKFQFHSVFLLGQHMKALDKALQQRKFQGHLFHSIDPETYLDYFLQHIQPGGVFLIKGSRGMKMEYVFEALKTFSQQHWL